MQKATILLTRDEMILLSGLIDLMIKAYDSAIYQGWPRWDCALKIASLGKMNMKIAPKLILPKKAEKVGFTMLDAGGFLSALADFKWVESDPYVLAFVTRFKLTFEQKFN